MNANRPKYWSHAVELARILLEFEIEQQQAAAAERLASEATEPAEPSQSEPAAPPRRPGPNRGGQR